MASLTMTTDVELKKKEGKFNPDHFNWIIVSEDIRIKGEPRDNISFMPSVFPPSEIMKFYNDRFDEMYIRYLDEVAKFPIAVLLKAIVDNNYETVFVCSLAEESIGYMRLLLEYIEEEFEIPTGKFKKLIKGNGEYAITDIIKEDLVKQLDEIIEKYRDKYKDIELFRNTHKPSKKK